MKISYMTIILVLGVFLVSPQYAVSTTRDLESVNEEYTKVIGKLDTGGDLLVFANMDGVIEAGVNYAVEFTSLMAGESTNTLPIVDTLSKIPDFLKDNGFYAVKGVGMSIVPTADNMNRYKTFISRDPAAAKLPLWRAMVGMKRAEIKSGEFLPADTVLFQSSMGDPKEFWKIVKQGLTELPPPETAASMAQGLVMSSAMLGISIDEIFNSLGSESFVSIQLSKQKNIEIPMGGPSGSALTCPEPSLLLGISVKDNTLPQLLTNRLASVGMTLTNVQKYGASIYTLNLPIPLPMPIAPSFVTHDGLLLIGSNQKVLADALSAYKNKNGLLHTADFKQLFGKLPLANNGMSYVSPRFSKTIMDYQAKTMALTPGNNAQSQKMIELLNKNGPDASASVTINLKTGVLMAGKGTSGIREIFMGAMMMPVGMVAGGLFPAMTQAREHATRAECQNNLRQFMAAKNQWALETKASKGADVSPEELMSSQMLQCIPTCPNGGVYILGPVGTPPVCNIPGHHILH